MKVPKVAPLVVCFHLGVNARLQNQITTWGNITCLLNHITQRMSGFSIVGEMTQWLTWLLWGM
jgi:hypothetical protein